MAANYTSGVRPTSGSATIFNPWDLTGDSSDLIDQAIAGRAASDSLDASAHSALHDSMADGTRNDAVDGGAAEAPSDVSGETLALLQQDLSKPTVAIVTADGAAQPTVEIGVDVGPALQSARWTNFGAASVPDQSEAPAGDVTDAGTSSTSSGDATCSCPTCSSLAGSLTDDTSSAADAAPAAPATLQTLADYLRVGYWTDTGRTSRWINVDDNGTGANFGVVFYNVSGYSGDGDGISDARKVMAREAFNIYEEVLGINFVETTSTSDAVDIFFGDNQSGAYQSAVLYGGTGGPIDYSVINVAASWSGFSSNIGGTNGYTFQTFIHEIGHALGLGHQGNYNAGVGTPTYGTSAHWENDSWQQTIMSYWSQTDNTSSSTSGTSYAQLVSPMAVDWIALNNLYAGQGFGATTFGTGQSFAGDTIWGFGTNISSATSAAYAGLADFADTNAFNIVDGSGIDTVNFSNYGSNQFINLTAASAFSTQGTISNVGGLVGNMTIAVGTIIENAVSGSGNDTIYGNTAANYLQGGAGNDSLYGSTGNDTLDGGTGADTLNGYDQDDLYIVDNVGDVITGEIDDALGGVDTVQASVTYTLIAALEHLTLTGGADIDGTGNAKANIITGNSGDNVLSGLAGNDTIYGGSGFDTLFGGADNDLLQGGFTTDDVHGGDGNDYLQVLNGEFYDNSYGDAGTDTLDHFASTYTGNTFDFEAGLISGGNTNTTTAVLSSIEIYYDGAGSNTIVSDGNGNSYYGFGGNDYMIAEIGGETMDGGVGGTDTIDLSRWNGTYAVNMATGSSSWGGELFTNFENLTSGNGNDTITGTSGANVINTNGGDDIINGSGGSDSVYGGAGNDRMFWGPPTPAFADVRLHDGQGDIDTIDGGGTNFGSGAGFNLAAGTYTNGGSFNESWLRFENYDNSASASGSEFVTGSGVANLIRTGGGNNDIFGSGGNDTLESGAGNDTVDGGGLDDLINAGTGNDSVFGGGGNDTIVDTEVMLASEDDIYNGGAAGSDTVVHDLNWISTVAFDLTTGFATLNGVNRDQFISIENLTVGGSASVRGSGAANVLIVNGVGANLINGEAGNDTIDGGGGDDTINGGSGNDSIVAGAGNDAVDGGDNNDTLYGGEGNDTLDGGTGTDSLVGGVGDDQYIASSTDVITENLGEGTDTVLSALASYTLVANLENLTLNGAGDQIGNGNNLGNTILGQGGDNLIEGFGSDDSLVGGAGNDTVRGGGSDDTVLGGAGDDSLFGGDGDDSIVGGGNDDTLNGGAGADTMRGSTGDDDYVAVGAGDVLIEGAGQGYDRVFSTISYTLAGNFEYLELTSGGAGTGNGIANTLVGNSGDNSLLGLGGADVLKGKGGDDSLFAGVDAVEDQFVFDTALNAATNVDTLFDAQFGEDQIRLSNDIFATLVSTLGTDEGTLAAANYFEGAGFVGGGAAAGKGIYYNLTNGNLYYNPTSAVGGDSILFATIDGSPASLSNTDFTLFTDVV